MPHLARHRALFLGGALRATVLGLVVFLFAWRPVSVGGQEEPGRQPRAVSDSPRLRVRIEGGSAAASSGPALLELTMGWRERCVLELENCDAVRREVSVHAASPIRIALPEGRIVVEPKETKLFLFLIQTLAMKEHEAEIEIGSDGGGCAIRVPVGLRPDPGGVRFGVLDHFEWQGPITAMPAPPEPREKSPRPPPGRGGPKDLSRLKAAPSGGTALRILDAMGPLQDLGCQMARIGINWSVIEQSPGAFSWDRADWMTNALRSKLGGGSELVAEIGYQPLWLPADFPTTNEGREAYSRWVRNVVARYADRVDYWELWNEPLLFWLRHPDVKPDKSGGERLSAEETDALAASYAEMILEVIRTASKIIREEDPGATILSPGFEDFLHTPGEVFPAFARDVYGRLLAGGMAEHVDGFCVHSYPTGYPGKAPPLGDLEAWKEFDRAADTGKLAEWLEEHGVRLPLYCTEFGGFRLPPNATAQDETPAALALLRNGCVLAHQGFRLVTYYELYDWDEQTLTYLMRSKDEHPTRGFLAYRELIAALAGATPCEVRPIPQTRIPAAGYEDLVVKAFRRGSEDILCVWNNAATPWTVRLRVASSDGRTLKHDRFAPKGDFLSERTWSSGEDIELTVAPLDFQILSCFSSSDGFGWLAESEISASSK